MTIPFDQRDGWIWMNGKMMEWKSAQAHVMHHALHYGGSVFEGIRMYNGEIFKLREHMDRLIRSADLIGMPITQYSSDDLCQAVKDAVEKNNLKDAYIRPLAWRGPEEMGIGATQCSTQVMVACWSWGRYFKGDEGLTLCTSKWRKPDPQTSVTASKCAAGYVVNTLAKHEAVHKGFGDALMLDYRGHVAEISAANIFMVNDGKVSTPIPDCFLNGITRLTVIDLCKNEGLDVIETRISPKDILTADEVFVTGTLAEVTPVTQIDETHFKIGEITKKLMEIYRRETKQV